MNNPPNSQFLPPPKHKVSRPLIITLFIVIVIGGVGVITRYEEAKSLAQSTEEQAILNVVTIKAPHGPSDEDIVLPGNIQAWHEAPIYARTSGYLKDWKTDIGTPVHAGDLIAEIETPEVDAQYHQAEADLAVAEANNQLAQTTAERWRNLLKTNSVSKQDADEKISAAEAGKAAVASARANLDHLRQLEQFKNVIAPFDGIITARNTDNGALINAGSGNSNGPELFHIAETDKLRVYVQVPEPYTPAITSDLVAELHLAEHPGIIYSAKLINKADALDPTARTLLIELEVDNDKNELMPGGYAEVHIKLPTATNTVRLPVNVLIFRSEGLQVATIGQDNRVVLKPVKVSRDFGNEVEVQSGIAPDEVIIINPPDSLTQGQQVHVLTSGVGVDKKP